MYPNTKKTLTRYMRKQGDFTEEFVSFKPKERGGGKHLLRVVWGEFIQMMERGLQSDYELT